MPALPNRAFDVRNLNNAVDADAMPYPRATGIVFKDNASKDMVIDVVCANQNYDALDPATRPSKQVFFNQYLQQHLKEQVRQARDTASHKAVPPADVSDLP